MNTLIKTKREIAVLLFISLTVMCTTSCYISIKDNDYEGIIRFHVIANSNSKEDQTLKLKVRDKVVATIEKEIATKAKTEGVEVDEKYTRNYVIDNMDRIKKMSEEVIKKNGFDYPIRTKLGVTYIPEKNYGDLIFPAGNYEALNIYIGEAKGRNWFCVIFPPLCLVKQKGKKALKLKFKIRQIIKSHKRR